LSAMGRCLLVIGLLAWGGASSQAEDLERGKSGPAIFAADCSACHRNAQGLAYGMSPSDLMNLLRQHYTTGPGPANQVATYLLSVVGNGRRPKEKPLTEPQSTDLAAPGEPGGKRHPRGDEPAAEPIGQRPPAEIRSNETAVGEEGAANERGRGPGSKRRQQTAHPAEPALPSRSKKLGQPAATSRGLQPELVRPAEPIRIPPSESVAARPAEPAAAAQPASPGETKPADTAPHPEGGKAESAAETGPVHVAAPTVAAPVEAQKPAARRQADDQPAFSAPSP
jgi:hypothetical protein